MKAGAGKPWCNSYKPRHYVVVGRYCPAPGFIELDETELK